MFNITQTQWCFPAQQFTRLSSFQAIPKAQSGTSPYPYLMHINRTTKVCEYFIRVKVYDYLNILEAYIWRFNSSLPIYKVFHGSLLDVRRQSSTIKVFIESEDYLLNSMKQMRFNDALSIIKCCLRTMQALVDKFGYFYLSEKMIGVTSDKLCKIWINSDFSRNEPECKAPSEEDAILNLLVLIRKHTEINRESNMFFNQLRKKILDFTSVFKFIEQTVSQSLINIPQFIVPLSRNTISHHSSQVRLSTISNNLNQYNNQSSNLNHEHNTPFRHLGFKAQTESLFLDKKHLMKKSKQTNKSNDSTNQIGLSLIILPQKSVRMEKNCKCKLTRAFEVKVGDRMKQSENIINNQSKSISNFWSDNDEKQLVEECLSRNNWKMTINNLFGGKKVELKNSIHIAENNKKPDPAKLQELKKLKLDKLTKTEDVFESIVQHFQQIPTQNDKNHEHNNPQSQLFDNYILQQSVEIPDCQQSQREAFYSESEFEQLNRNKFSKNNQYLFQSKSQSSFDSLIDI